MAEEVLEIDPCDSSRCCGGGHLGARAHAPRDAHSGRDGMWKKHPGAATDSARTVHQTAPERELACQVPKYVMEDAVKNGEDPKIVVTQLGAREVGASRPSLAACRRVPRGVFASRPRRMAAVSLARRCAAELGEAVLGSAFFLACACVHRREGGGLRLRTMFLGHNVLGTMSASLVLCCQGAGEDRWIQDQQRGLIVALVDCH